MPNVIEKSSGKVYSYDSELAKTLVDSGGFDFEEGALLDTKSAEGTNTTVAASDLEHFQKEGQRLETAAESQAVTEEAALQENHGGLGSRIATGVEAAVDTVGLGIPGAVARVVAPGYNKKRIKRYKANPKTAFGAETGTLLFGGFGSVGKGLLGKSMRLTPLGKTVVMADKAIDAGKIAKGFAVEGAITGAAMELQALTISEDPLTIERIGTQMGTGALLGGATGFGGGVFGKAVTKGVLKGKKVLQGGSKGVLKGKKVLQGGSKVDDVARGTDAITDATEDAQSLVKRFDDHRNSDINVISVLYGSEKRVMNAQRGVKGRMTKLMDESTGLAEKPRSMLGTLRREAQILAENTANPGKLLAKGAKHDAEVLALVNRIEPGSLVTGKAANALADFRGQKLTRVAARKGIKATTLELAEFSKALSDGTLAAKRSANIDRFPELLESNRALQRSVLDAVEAGKKSQDGFMGTLVTGGAFSAGTGAAGAVLPDELGFAAPLVGGLAARKMNALLFGRMGKAAKHASKRADAAVDAFMGGAKASRKVATPLALKVLKEAHFGEPDPEVGPKKTPPTDKLLAVYKQKEAEIYGQVQMGPKGIEMRPDAREKIYNNLEAVRAVSPGLADDFESMHARKIEFIARKLPKRPDSVAMSLGPSNWRPSDMAIRELARYVAAIEDPTGVFERVVDGTVTPEDGEAMREVYPQQFSHFQEQVMTRLPELREQLDYRKRLALSIFTGVPVDPAMDPRVLSILQGNYLEESGGGNSAPAAAPQFGSVSKPEPTPGQKRSK